MTLAVSVRIPDGVVIAVDSLSTVGGNLNLVVDAGFKCKTCQTENEIKNLRLPPVAFPVSTKSYAQKLFKFREHYGVACYGNGFVNGKTMHNQIRSLEQSISGQISTVDVVAEKLLYHFEKELRSEVKDLDKLPEKFVPFGFQAVGFDGNGLGKTWIVEMGRLPNKRAESQPGATYSGDIGLVMRLLKQDPSIPTPLPNWQTFSLQDAVDYAKFFIRFVADYQRFANMIPTVGGDIDVALVTSYSGFKWIEQKKISKLLEQ